MTRLLQTISDRDVARVISDVQLAGSGVRLHFCVDPHEISTFCFPFEPQTLRPPDVDSIAQDQIAQYEVFFNHPRKPILAPEYAHEIFALLTRLQYIADQVYSRAEMLTALIRQGKLDIALATSGTASDADMLQFAESDFGTLLAVAIGIYAIGLERFELLVRERLTTFPEDDQDGAALAEIWNGHKPSIYAEHLYGQLYRRAVDARERFRYKDDGNDVRSRKRSWADAAALDRVYQINLAVDDAFRAGKLRHRHLFLYFSGAPRTSTVFATASMRPPLVTVGSAASSIWRNRKFAYIFAANKVVSDGVANLDVRKSVLNLRRFRTAIAEISHVRTMQRCQDCIVAGGRGILCANAEICEHIVRLTEHVAQRREAMENMGLLAAVRDYSELAATEGDQFQKYTVLLQRLSTLEVGSLAVKRVQQIQRAIFVKSTFAARLSQQIGARTIFLREGRDVITSAAQYLPIRPRLVDPFYISLAKRLIDWFGMPAQEEVTRAQLDATFDVFLERDATTRDLIPEHELLRCFIYFALPGALGEGDHAVLRHARAMARQFPTHDREFTYFAIWAARRTHHYSLAQRLATRAIQEWPDDARFYHGRSINTYAWSWDLTAADRPLTIELAVTDSQRALELYLKGLDDREIIGAIYNNLAFFCAQDRAARAHDLRAARRYLLKLRDVIPKIEWKPLYPEYYHTEAHLEFEEARAALAVKDFARARMKIAAAAREIDVALSILPADAEFAQLKHEIDETMSRIPS